LGIRAGMAILTPALLIGSVIVVSAGRFVKDDIARIYPDYGAGAAQGPVIQPGDTL
jgi:hypothetical protein